MLFCFLLFSVCAPGVVCSTAHFSPQGVNNSVVLVGFGRKNGVSQVTRNGGGGERMDLIQILGEQCAHVQSTVQCRFTVENTVQM